jgi:glycosidase
MIKASLPALCFAILLAACATRPRVPEVSTHATPASEVFYHVMPRSFRDGNGDHVGDLKGLTAKLDYLHELGITSVLLTPLQPSPYYHNYFASEFKAIDPAYGTMDDYFAFVRAAHAHGLKLYLDQEFQYVAEGHPWWEESKCKPGAPRADYLLWRDKEHCIAEYFLDKPKWKGYDGRDYGIAMVDLKQPKVQRYFRDLMLFWIDPHGDGSGVDGVDGLRIDHMMDDLDHKGIEKHLFADFWVPMFRELKARRPTLRILAEQADWGYGDDWLKRGHADLVFAFPLRGALTKLDKREIVNAIRVTEAKTPRGKSQVLFLENHDVDRYMSIVGDDPARARAGAAILLTLQGEPLIYYGQELGMRGRELKNIEISDGIQIPAREAFRWRADLEAPGSAIWYRGGERWWSERYSRSHDGVSLEEEEGRPDSIYGWYRKLLALRHDRVELRAGSQRILCDDGSNVLCILRSDGSRQTLLIVNLGQAEARPGLDAATIGGADWVDLLDGKPAAPVDAPLKPMQVRLLGTH